MIKNMDVISILRQLGLNQRESQVYLASLELGQFASAGQLAKLASVNRGTTYHIVKELEKKGFLRSTKRNDIINYIAESIDRILSLLEQQQAEIEAKQNLLKKTANVFNNITKKNQFEEIDFFYGYENVLNFYKNLPWKNEHYSIFCPQIYESIFPMESFYGTGGSNMLSHVKGRVLVSKTNYPNYNYCIDLLREVPGLVFREFNAGLLLTDTIIFPNKFVVIINLNKDNLNGVKISCLSLIESYIKMFEKVWDRAAKK